VRIAEIDLEAGIDAELGVLRHFRTLVPGQRPSQVFGQRGDGGSDGVTDRLGAVPSKGWAIVLHRRTVLRHAR
jgi:hypothetical protein